MDNLLEINNLHTYFYTDTGLALAVEGVSFTLQQGETLALVGESGCGKTVTALSIMRLVPQPAGEIVQGEIIFQNQNLLSLTEPHMRRIRGQHIGMIFQEPQSAFNPLYTIGAQIEEALRAHHQTIGRREIKKQVIQLLEKVEIPGAQERSGDYPHNLSGGLRQRAMIAQALACGPQLLIADEPTTALDLTIQAQILQLFSRLKKTSAMSFLLISHDLGIVAEIADRVCLMYAGKIVEEADVLAIFHQPKHPYTKGLLDSMPAKRQAHQRLKAIPGAVPHPQNKPSGCAFHPRCPQADLRCQNELPPFLEIDANHKVSCWKAQ